ncbi:MAG: MFS transporter, partial [Acidisphaera sp.]|nr:MFS transporter [Acidisphaera sp.]
MGFACGLPLPLSGFTLGQWMSEAGVSLGAIGLSATIGLSYSLKFLWSPVLDRVAPPGPLRRLGRRRGWLLAIQPALAAACALLALSDPARAPAVTVGVAAVIAFLSASQDIVVDAWRIETFPARSQGTALAAYVWGYRLALLAANAGVIRLASVLGWHGSLLVAAGLSCSGLLTTLCAAEPTVPPDAASTGATPPAGAPDLRASFSRAVVDPLREFLQRPRTVPVLGFVLLFNLGEALAGVMLPPYYRALGYGRNDVALA